jgi:predicted DNA-binding transcriptional regulator AlpA
MPSKQPDRFLSFAEVAEMIGLNEGTLRNGECGTKDIPRIKLGSRVVFSFNAVQRWMERKAREAEVKIERERLAVIDLLSERRRIERAMRST